MKSCIEFYIDQELDSESNLYNYDARLYDPVIGRFLSVDSIIPKFYQPQSLNPYSYCLNNPLIYTDPSGHFSWPWEWDWSKLFTNKDDFPPQPPPPPPDDPLADDPAITHIRKISETAKQVNETANNVLNDLQGDLDNAGLVPWVGEPADGLNAAISTARGNYSDAALSAGSMLPYIGVAGPIVKREGKIIKWGKNFIGSPYPTKLNRAGKLQPFDPATGKFLSYAANPGFIRSQASCFGAGFGQGYANSKGIEGGTPLGAAGKIGYIAGYIVGNIPGL